MLMMPGTKVSQIYSTKIATTLGRNVVSRPWNIFISLIWELPSDNLTSKSMSEWWRIWLRWSSEQIITTTIGFWKNVQNLSSCLKSKWRLQKICWLQAAYSSMRQTLIILVSQSRWTCFGLSFYTNNLIPRYIKYNSEKYLNSKRIEGNMSSDQYHERERSIEHRIFRPSCFPIIHRNIIIRTSIRVTPQ